MVTVHYSFNCLDYSVCTVGGDELRRYEGLLQRDNGGFLPDSLDNTFRESLIDDVSGVRFSHRNAFTSQR